VSIIQLHKVNKRVEKIKTGQERGGREGTKINE
jgi:hypothetical protein